MLEPTTILWMVKTAFTAVYTFFVFITTHPNRNLARMALTLQREPEQKDGLQQTGILDHDSTTQKLHSFHFSLFTFYLFPLFTLLFGWERVLFAARLHILLRRNRDDAFVCCMLHFRCQPFFSCVAFRHDLVLSLTVQSSLCLRGHSLSIDETGCAALRKV